MGRKKLNSKSLIIEQAENAKIVKTNFMIQLFISGKNYLKMS